MEKIKPHLNAYLVIQNQKIFKIIDKRASLDKAFLSLNKVLADNLASFIDLIYKPGLINIDFADFKTILAGKGEKLYFNSAEAKGPNRAQEVTKKVLNSPIFDFNIKKPRRILFNIAAAPNLKMKEVEEICSDLSSLSRQAKIIFGVSPSLGKNRPEIRVSLLVTGDAKKATKKGPSKVEPKAEVKKTKKKAKAKKKIKKKVKTKIKKKIKKKTVRKKPLAKKRKLERKKATKKKRLSALEVKKVAQEEEDKRWAEEEKWEIPAFLRRSPWREKVKNFKKK